MISLVILRARVPFAQENTHSEPVLALNVPSQIAFTAKLMMLQSAFLALKVFMFRVMRVRNVQMSVHPAYRHCTASNAMMDTSC